MSEQSLSNITNQLAAAEPVTAATRCGGNMRRLVFLGTFESPQHHILELAIPQIFGHADTCRDDGQHVVELDISLFMR
jgi:hypothetical protein